MLVDMKKYAFLKLFPCPGGYNLSGNEVLAEHECKTEQEAIEHFKNQFFAIPLDDTGYAKVGPYTYTIAQYFC